MEDAELLGEGDAFDQHVAQNEWRQLNEAFTTAGLREGIDAGKESSLQPAFNQGFVEASAIAFELGQLRGVLSTILAFDQKYRPIDTELRQRVAELYERVSGTKCTKDLAEADNTTLGQLREEVAQCVRDMGYEMA